MNQERRNKLNDSENLVVGYCVHCRTKRPMLAAIQVCNKRGGRDLKGHCSVCGISMYRLGGWDSVAAASSRQGSSIVSEETEGS